MANPVLFLAQLNGSLAFQDRAGGGTLTGSGAVRYAPASGARTNYAPNPRFASGTGNYSGNGGGTITRIASDSLLGTCGEVVGSSVDDGVTPLTANVPALGSGVVMTVSFDAYLVSGASDWQLEPSWRTGSGGWLSSGAKQDFTPTGEVQRFKFTVTGITAAHRLYPKITRKTAAAGVLRFTKLLIEIGDTAGTWFEPVWLDPITGILGTAHASPSVSQAVAWVEEGTTNLLRNPSAEVDASLLTASGATLTRDTTYAYYGSASFKVVTNNAATNEGLENSTVNTLGLTGTTPFTGTSWVRGGGTLNLIILLLYSDATSDAATQAFTANDTWTRISVSITPNGAKTVNQVFLRVRTQTQQAATFYVDGMQIENKAYATSYCDGSLGTGYAWSGTAHASSSTRTAAVLKATEAGRISEAVGAIAMHATRLIDVSATTVALFDVGNGTAGEDRVLIRADTSGRFDMTWRSNGGSLLPTSYTSPIATVGTKRFVYGGWRGTSVSVSVDNGSLTTGTRDATVGDIDSGDDMQIGSAKGLSQFNGYIGPVLIADRPLTAKERAMLNARTSWGWSTLKGGSIGRLTPF